MHRQVSAPFEQRLFELLDEQPLAADLRQGAVEDAVAARRHAEQFDTGTRMERAQALAHVLGLPEGERAFAGGDDPAFGHGRRRRRVRDRLCEFGTASATGRNVRMPCGNGTTLASVYHAARASSRAFPSPDRCPTALALDPAADDALLRDEIRLLGRLLGEVLRGHGGAALYETIESVRQTATRFRRDGNPQDAQALDRQLKRLDRDATVSVVRAFSYFLQLANIAEDQSQVRLQRERRAAGVSFGAGRGARTVACARPRAGPDPRRAWRARRWCRC